MKAVVYSPAALAQFADILSYTIERFGAAQAEVNTARLAGRLEALTSGHGPNTRHASASCGGCGKPPG